MPCPITLPFHLRLRPALATAVATAFCLSFGASAALADDTLRIGNPGGDSFSFLPLTIGEDLGIFAKHKVGIEVTTYSGSAALEDALAKGTVEIALGSGTEFAFIPKGAPDTAVATLAVRPSLLVISAKPDSGIKRDRDLKGHSIGVDAVDPLPAWLVKSLSLARRWGPDGIKALPLSEPLVSDYAINASVDGVVIDLPEAMGIEARGNGKTVVNFGDVVKNFPFYVAFARNDLIDKNPDAIKNFLTAWFETVKWMQDHRKETIVRAAKTMGVSEEIAEKLYATLVPAYSTDGKFDANALKTLAKAMVDMGVIDREQDLGRYVKEDFLGSSCANK